MTQYVEQDRRGGRSVGIVVGVIVVLMIVAALAFGLLKVTQTRTAELPEVKVEGGQAPAYDVKAAKVDVDQKAVAVEVPKVSMTTTKVAVPTVHVDKAN